MDTDAGLYVGCRAGGQTGLTPATTESMHRRAKSRAWRGAYRSRRRRWRPGQPGRGITPGAERRAETGERAGRCASATRTEA